MSDTPTTSAPRAGRGTVRARIRLALAGLLLLIVPQIALTVYYLVELQSASARVAALTGFVVDLGTLRSATQAIEMPPAPELEAADRAAFEGSVDGAIRAAGELAESASDSLREELAAVHEGLVVMRAAGVAWLSTVLEAKQALPGPGALEKLLRAPPSETGLDMAALVRDYGSARADLADRIDDAFVRAYEGLRFQQDQVDRVVDHADRNLVALTMISLVFVIALVIMLPARLLRPLIRLEMAVRKAGTSELPLPPDDMDDEVGRLASAFRETMLRIREFDARKRDRIVQDSAKLDVLLERTGVPAALLTSRLRIERSSRSFRALVGLTGLDDEAVLPDLLSDGSDALRQLLNRAVQQREGIEGAPVEIIGADGATHRFSAVVDLCRDRRGRVNHLLLALVPKTAEKAA